MVKCVFKNQFAISMEGGKCYIAKRLQRLLLILVKIFFK